MTIANVSRRLAARPGTARRRGIARDLLARSGSLTETIQGAGLKLTAAERKFLSELPPAIGGALRGAVFDSLGPSGGGRLNFDLAYKTTGTGYALTISAPKRNGDVEMVLVAPRPKGGASSKPKRKPKAKTKRAPARKRR